MRGAEEGLGGRWELVNPVLCGFLLMSIWGGCETLPEGTGAGGEGT